MNDDQKDERCMRFIRGIIFNPLSSYGVPEGLAGAKAFMSLLTAAQELFSHKTNAYAWFCTD